MPWPVRAALHAVEVVSQRKPPGTRPMPLLLRPWIRLLLGGAAQHVHDEEVKEGPVCSWDAALQVIGAEGVVVAVAWPVGKVDPPRVEAIRPAVHIEAQSAFCHLERVCTSCAMNKIILVEQS